MLWPFDREAIAADDLATAEILKNTPDEKFGIADEIFLADLMVLVSPGRRSGEACVEQQARLRQQARQSTADSGKSSPLPPIPSYLRAPELAWRIHTFPQPASANCETHTRSQP
jgi:hypothetical protein